MTSVVELMLKYMASKNLDPWLVFVTVIGMDVMARETCVGTQLEPLLVRAASERQVTVEHMLSDYRKLFYGTKKEGMMGVHRVSNTPLSDTWAHAKKKEVLLLYLQSVEVSTPQMPVLVQIIWAGRDMKSGARTHKIFSNAQDSIIASQEMFCAEKAPLAIMEVPNKTQGIGKFYIDWDMTMERLAFLEGTPCEKIAQVYLI
jgi:hypothetical protein